MTVFITGAAGFIGSHLAERLIGLGEIVHALDNFSTGNAENVKHLKDNERFHLHEGNVLDVHTVNRLSEKADVIYHLAAVVGVKLVFDQPVQTIDTNVTGTSNILDAATRHGCRVVITSSSEVYGTGNKQRTPFKEADPLSFRSSLRWSYACSKALDEYLARAYSREKKLPVSIARLFNCVGPRQTGAYGMVIPSFVSQALNEEPITVHGDGEQVRCFAWVGDVVDNLIKLMQEPKAEGESFNVGSDEPVTINELAKKIKEKCNSTSPIVHIPYDEAFGVGFEDIRHRVPDLTKLRCIVKSNPVMSLDTILSHIISSGKASLDESEGN